MIGNVTVFNNCYRLPDMSYFGKKLRELREKKGVSGWTIEKITTARGEEHKLLRSAISNIESGRSKPTEDIMQKLASIPDLGVSYEELEDWKMIDEYGEDKIMRCAKRIKKSEETDCPNDALDKGA